LLIWLLTNDVTTSGSVAVPVFYDAGSIVRFPIRYSLF